MLTAKEIEEARSLVRAAMDRRHPLYGRGCLALDALYAAARQDSLVGQRVLVRAKLPGERSHRGRITFVSQLGEYTVVPDGAERSMSRDDFEVLEGDDA